MTCSSPSIQRQVVPALGHWPPHLLDSAVVTPMPQPKRLASEPALPPIRHIISRSSVFSTVRWDYEEVARLLQCLAPREQATAKNW